jgi:twitching motility protein PilJ
VQETARRIKRLGESSKEIGEIVKLIGGIADRTSILALNAAIQAASAGEAGRGFAVVAEEVQRLSERSTEATRQISALVTSIQSETQDTVVSMEESTREVVEGSRIADLAGQALAEINTVAERIATIVQSITEAVARQADRSAKLSATMEGIAGMTAQTADSTRQSAAAVLRMAELADALRASVSPFRLPERSAPVIEDEHEVALGAASRGAAL